MDESDKLGWRAHPGGIERWYSGTKCLEKRSQLVTRSPAQCVNAGLIDGSKIYVDSSLVDPMQILYEELNRFPVDSFVGAVDKANGQGARLVS